MLEVCGRLGGRLLLVEASTSTHADADAEAIVRDLRMLAILAIPMGIRIAFKGVSWSRTVRDFAAAGELVFRANCPNLGLAIDAFDVLAARIPLDELDAIDPEQIFLVQLSDYMWQEIRSAEEQAATATHFRVFPGEGAHSDGLADFVSKLDAIGYCGDYSFDVYNDDYLQMPPETVAHRARRAAEWLGETVLRRALPVPEHGAPAAHCPPVTPTGRGDARRSSTQRNERMTWNTDDWARAASRCRRLPRHDDVRRSHRRRRAQRIVDAAFDAGVNFIDTADAYAQGRVRAHRRRRDRGQPRGAGSSRPRSATR